MLDLEITSRPKGALPISGCLVGARHGSLISSLRALAARTESFPRSHSVTPHDCAPCDVLPHQKRSDPASLPDNQHFITSYPLERLFRIVY